MPTIAERVLEPPQLFPLTLEPGDDRLVYITRRETHWRGLVACHLNGWWWVGLDHLVPFTTMLLPGLGRLGWRQLSAFERRSYESQQRHAARRT